MCNPCPHCGAMLCIKNVDDDGEEVCEACGNIKRR